MSEAEAVRRATATASEAQAGTLRAKNKPRWALFFFFRVLSQAEMAATLSRLKAVGDATTEAAKSEALNALQLDIENPSLLNTGLAKEGAPAAVAFRDWLKVLVRADADPLKKAMEDVVKLLSAKAPATPVPDSPAAFLADAGALLERLRNDYEGMLQDVTKELRSFATAGAPQSVLQKVVLHELLRQGAPAFLQNGRFGAVMSEADQDDAADLGQLNARTPVNISFTYEGLKALNIDEVTLASFPDVFKDGMAARAARLYDVGPSSPENWEGELGQRSVHGFFRSGSPLDGDDKASEPTKIREAFWEALREDIRRFNEGICPQGQKLRLWLGLMFRMTGLEVLHIELGQDPYHLDRQTGETRPTKHRKEHFGFRDGISQPFVDLGLDPPAPGGGTPSRASTWAPVAPGEIFLNEKDEDGDDHLLPINADLRLGSTFTVFRKLEQDVQAFRTYLEVNRPQDPAALGAQFFGRWPNGMPLVLSPNQQPKVHDEAEPVLNDFRYAAMDPFGLKCPLGAHVRRSNPRDIAGAAARRHRILRRGISYGGPLIEEGEAPDGQPRGILFIAENARIDLQFEVVQGDWINGGEFLGQAGLGRCPVTGTHAGRRADSFLEAGRVAPLTGLPQFVITRGGDYFFTPGISALAGIARGHKFPPQDAHLPYGGYSMGDATNRPAIDEARLKAAARKILSREQRLVRITLPTPTGKTAQNIVLVALHADAQRLLGNRLVPGKGKEEVVEVSAYPYRASAHSITRGHEVLVGTDPEKACGAADRVRLWAILKGGWATLSTRLGGTAGDETNLQVAVRKTVQDRLETTLRRAGSAGAIDLVGDLAVPATYAVLCEIYGVAGPSWISELAAGYPFARQHVGDLPTEWLSAIKGGAPHDPGQTTMQFWSAFLLADLIGNFQERGDLRAVARQAGSELLNHLDLELAESRARASAKIPRATLIDSIAVNAEQDPTIRDLYRAHSDAEWRKHHDRDAALLLLEIIGTTLAVVPLTFASVMEQLLKNRIDLRALLNQRCHGTSATRIIYEAERLNPNVPIRMRRCEQPVVLPATPFGDAAASISPGEYIGTIITAAHLDMRRFDLPELFWPFDGPPPGCNRPRNTETDYLLFGAMEKGADGKESNKRCWGRDRVAMPVLEECLEAAGRLGGLRRVAGKAGEPQNLVGIKIGLKARFTRVEPATASADGVQATKP